MLCTPEKVLESWDVDSESDMNSESSENNIDDYITFSTWTREKGKIKKVLKSVLSHQFWQDWHQTIANLTEHIHRKRVQVESYNSHKAELKKGEALVHVDYTESYKNKQ